MAYETFRIKDTTNGWLVVDENGKKHIVFCKEDANSSEDAITVYEESKSPTGE
jgi:hypothetical protein